MSIRVRFAPSPTGALHIGGVRTALFNYLLAKKHGGTFILRIEDTDKTRYVEGAEAYIIEALKWCGIAPTEGIGFCEGQYAPYRQSDKHNEGTYKKYAAQLIAEGKAYYAFDTPEDLEAMREKLKGENHQSYSAATRSRADLGLKNSYTLGKEAAEHRVAAGEMHVIRLAVPENRIVTINDLIRGEVNFNTSELDDKVLLKADGMPTYHLANIVDDYEMKITHVIRGEEWLPSAGHHVLIYEAFGWSAEMPHFAHLPLILRPDGKGKLSKRDGERFGFPVFPLSWAEKGVLGFDGFGFDAKAVINFLALLGWNDGTEQEIFSIDELAAAFSLEKINKSGARFDFEKAKWFNQQYLMAMTDAEIAEKLTPLSIEKGYNVSEAFLTRFAGMMKERVIVFNDFLEKGYYFFENPRYDEETAKKKWKPENRTKFEALADFIANLNFDTPLSMEADVKTWIGENGLKVGDVLPILRLALAGTMQGPAIFEMASILGKEETIQRLHRAFDAFDKL